MHSTDTILPDILLTGITQFTHDGVIGTRHRHSFVQQNSLEVVKHNFQQRFPSTCRAEYQEIRNLLYRGEFDSFLLQGYSKKHSASLFRECDCCNNRRNVDRWRTASTFRQTAYGELVWKLSRWTGSGGPVSWPSRSPNWKTYHVASSEVSWSLECTTK